MEHSEVSRRRRMVRRFDPQRPVPEPVLEALVDAALRAPSAGDTQGVSLLALDTAATVDAYWEATARPGPPDRWLRGMRTAPVLILVWSSRQAYLDRYAEPDKGWSTATRQAGDPGRSGPAVAGAGAGEGVGSWEQTGPWSAPYWFVDAGMASMAVLLAAVDAGLGACFFGVPPEHAAAVREVFGVPADQLSVGVVALGYAPADGSRGARRRPRKATAERFHRGRWTAAGDD